MKNTVIIGTFSGDEGKGRVIDYLLNNKPYNIVARFGGGNNCGHSIHLNGQKYVTHGLPSGILDPSKMNVIGNGCVVNPTELVEEIHSFTDRKIEISPKNLMIDFRAHLIMPYHVTEDKLYEASSNKPFGSTKKGIAPCYKDKSGKKGFRFHDLINNNQDIKELFGNQTIDFLRPFIGNVSKYLNDKDGILFEGAQAVGLDIDMGTYPYTTSSNCLVAQAALGTGIPHTRLNESIGILKAYSTRVAVGAFPTEVLGLDGQRLQEVGQEVGATTGRKRRCGWLDLAYLCYANRVCGLDALAVTKLDVLSHFKEIPVCTSYTDPDQSEMDLNLAKPNFIVMKGWQKDITQCKKLQQLPKEAIDYLALIEKISGIPIKFVSVGPNREQMIEV